MITCHIRYELDADRIEAFERYARMWLEIVPRLGGVHHGYFLPSEGASDVAMSTFSFPSFAAYEAYRQAAAGDSEAQAAIAFAAETRCFRRYDRTFFRPLLPA